MRVEIIDRDAFSAIRPEALLRFLTVNNWKEARRVEGELIVLSKTNKHGTTQLVWMPTSDQYTDYAPMVAKLVKTVSEVEDKSELQLLDDLETVATGDVIRVRSYNPLDEQDYTLPLGDGVNLLSRARLIALAGAASAVKMSAVHPRWPYLEANQFVRNLRLGQTERGSYLIRLISPISEQPRQDEGQFAGMPDAEPFSRRAVVEMIRGLNALRHAANDNRKRGKFFFNSFLEAVPLGVSANLCEAVTSADDETLLLRPIEIGVTWSYAVSRTDNLPTAGVHFDSSIIPFIKEAAQEFRARNPEVLTLNGWVHILERGSRPGPGQIRMYSKVDDRIRAIRIELEKDAYDLAIDAHKRGSLVIVTGTLIVENGYIYRLEKPTDFRIIEQEGFSDIGESDT
jgi:hypothetical protein